MDLYFIYSRESAAPVNAIKKEIEQTLAPISICMAENCDEEQLEEAKIVILLHSEEADFFSLNKTEAQELRLASNYNKTIIRIMCSEEEKLGKKPVFKGASYFWNNDKSYGKKALYYQLSSLLGKPALGYGEFRFPDGRKYEGEWSNGTLHGNGVMTWPNGNRYEGLFANGKREGYGVMTWGSGNEYKGYWANDMWHGKGVKVSSDGVRKEGEFRNGVLVESEKVFRPGNHFVGQTEFVLFIIVILAIFLFLIVKSRDVDSSSNYNKSNYSSYDYTNTTNSTNSINSTKYSSSYQSNTSSSTHSSSQIDMNRIEVVDRVEQIRGDVIRYCKAKRFDEEVYEKLCSYYTKSLARRYKEYLESDIYDARFCPYVVEWGYDSNHITSIYFKNVKVEMQSDMRAKASLELYIGDVCQYCTYFMVREDGNWCIDNVSVRYRNEDGKFEIRDFREFIEMVIRRNLMEYRD
ncbi:MAG: hypothetical protein MJZ14_01950 [Paludibacteraceae bacterium]|nr:hypothetical protein [Paludibacteraceae bacterium]